MSGSAVRVNIKEVSGVACKDEEGKRWVSEGERGC